jgi:hypothetical protein
VGEVVEWLRKDDSSVSCRGGWIAEKRKNSVQKAARIPPGIGQPTANSSQSIAGEMLPLGYRLSRDEL